MTFWTAPERLRRTLSLEYEYTMTYAAKVRKDYPTAKGTEFVR